MFSHTNSFRVPTRSSRNTYTKCLSLNQQTAKKELGVQKKKKEKTKIEIKEYGKGDPSTASIQSLAVSFSSILQYPSTLICLFIRNSMASLKLTMANPHKAIACCPWCLPLLQLLLGTITIITTYAMAWQCLNNSLAKKRV